MDILQYHRSVAEELNAVKHKIRDLMNNPHWLTDGEIKESILRNILRRHLPGKYEIGRGFIFTPTGCSKQIDLLVYDSSFPVIFREQDLVFVTPDAVRAIIEVKTKTTAKSLSKALDNLIHNVLIVEQHYRQFTQLQLSHYSLFTGIFSFETDIQDPDIVLELLYHKAKEMRSRVVNHLCLNDSLFFKFWESHVWTPYEEWHSYHLERLAPAYFLNNIVNEVAPISVFSNMKFWFPLGSKEIYKTGAKRLYNQSAE
ncbi:MAG: hypothetical protein NTU47_04185 [Ignavibacteriales bacterium]|nr:hypothetical protein [Ignavibacteriales bacterium]